MSKCVREERWLNFNGRRGRRSEDAGGLAFTRGELFEESYSGKAVRQIAARSTKVMGEYPPGHFELAVEAFRPHQNPSSATVKLHGADVDEISAIDSG